MMAERTVGKDYDPKRHEIDGRPRTYEEMINYLYSDAKTTIRLFIYDLKALGYLPDDIDNDERS